MSNRIVWSTVLAVALAGWGVSVDAQVYVVSGGTGARDGSSWSDALGTIQEGLDRAAAMEAELWVSAGIYVSDVLSWPGGVAAYGGFPAGGGDWEDRDPWAHGSILSRLEHGSMIEMGEAGEVVLDGFTLMESPGGFHGLVTIGDRFTGAAVRARVAQCAFINNNNRDGAIKIEGGAEAEIVQCYFKNNNAAWDHQGRGGAIQAAHDAVGMVSNSVFIGNRATDTHGGGSAIFGASRAQLTIAHCTFYGNRAPDGASVIRGPFEVKHSILWDNIPDNAVSAGATLVETMDDVDPGFLDASGGDVRLREDSSVVVAGSRTVAGVGGVVPELCVDGDWRSVADVEASLHEAGLHVGRITRVYSDTVPEGSVIGVEPGPGTEVPADSAVDLTVSGGPASALPLMSPSGFLALTMLLVMVVLGAFMLRRRIQ